MAAASDSDRAELIRRAASRRSRRTSFSRERPTKWHPTSVMNPGDREPFTPDGCWSFLAEAIAGGAAVEVIALKHPPGKRGFVIMLPGMDGALIYVKLQLLSDVVLGRSFHLSVTGEEDEDDD
jgi:hypothetical protein